MEYLIETEGLTKRFDGLVAVDRINLRIKKGELFGLLGPNGAGKTTTLSMLSTILPKTAGSARVCGFDIDKEQAEVRGCIGIVFQDPSLDDELTGWENLDFHGRLYGVEKGLRKKRGEEVLKLVGLWDRRNDLVKKYSGGMRRRLEIARGLIHHPRVLFLDEPTLGLDPQTRRGIWEHIEELNKKEEITIILTTHYMEEADYLCDRVAIIDHGRIIAEDSPTKLKKSLGGDVVKLGVKGCSEGDFEKLKRLDFVKNIKATDCYYSLTVDDGELAIPKIFDMAKKIGMDIVSVDLHKPTLEDIFIHYTGHEIREEGANAKDRMRLRRGVWAGRR
jgi:ABC-2 type transport system ATP-binding protein